jgi:hypothetical protein
MREGIRSAVAAASLLVLACGVVSPQGAGPSPPPEGATAGAAVEIDPEEEVISPESPPAVDGIAVDEPTTAAAAEPDAGAIADAGEPLAPPDPRLLDALDAAEAKATPEGRLVLETGRRMALVDRVVIVGACWDYANTVYKRAGFPANARRTVYNKPKTGPYADPKLFAPGDFLSYSHDARGEWVHSAIFVDWVDRGARVALMLTYVGKRKRMPGLYARNELSHVFRVVRPRP